MGENEIQKTMDSKDQKEEKSLISKDEEKILAFWNENKIFEKSLEKKSKAGDFVFYDGPPFATGLPHYGHILQSIIKDVIPRYKTMHGYRVPRRWGWDCHGLPLENIIESELGIRTKKEIEDLGVQKFNQSARNAVLRFADDWRRIIPRIGRWADMQADYKTMDASYTESVWWSFKTLYGKGLIYEGYKSMHLCSRCGTTLSNFEVNQGYKDIKDISIYAKFELVDEGGSLSTSSCSSPSDTLPSELRTGHAKTYVLAWTTTPWTLPGNVALAVNKKIIYSQVEVLNEKSQKKEYLIIAKDRLESVFKNIQYQLVKEIKGNDLIGKSYKPIFDYYFKEESLKNKENASSTERSQSFGRGWKTYSADFVTTDEGTGIVHIAPAFGEDDMLLGQKENLPFIQHVAEDGRMKMEVLDFKGMAVKPKGEDKERLATDIAILKNLEERNLFFAKENITHSYPHCWRCDTPLINYASSSWFVKVSDDKLHEKIISENQKIHWVPEHLRDGRFGKWLLGAKDWAISRSRYWGAPIPVWKCKECKKVEVIGSVEDTKKHALKSHNKYFVMRHGQAENNVLEILSSDPKNPHHLTEEGVRQVKNSISTIKEIELDFIFSSDFIRTKETAEIVRESTGLEKSALFFDERLREVNFGQMNNHPTSQYHGYFDSMEERFEKRVPEGENLLDVKKRVSNFIYELESKYNNKKILIITHSTPAWMMISGAKGLTTDEAIKFLQEKEGEFIKNSEIKSLDFVPIPHNENYDLDLHRPFIDEILLKCDCGAQLQRVSGVFDCWYESGSMPYASAGYLGKPKEDFDPKRGVGYPADFIGEAVDQTRGWFYTMHVLGVALFDKTSFLNVTSTGLILAEDGQKMSKRLKNYPDPMFVVGKYGADALRYYFLNSPVVRGGDLNFSEKEVQEIMNKVIGRLKNVVLFFEQNKIHDVEYGIQNLKEIENVLDKWIVIRLYQLFYEVTRAMENYELDKATRPIEGFVEDLSTWYIRRSRDRMRDGDSGALNTTYHVLRTLSLIMAPFMPFVSEEIWQGIKKEDDVESVHLASWPVFEEDLFQDDLQKNLVEKMSEARKITSFGLEARMRANIKVRQPLASLKIRSTKSEIRNNLGMQDLIKEEVNVKEIIFDDSIENEAEIDTNITEELKEEGMLRDLVRAVQDLRKKSGLKTGEQAVLYVQTEMEGESLIRTIENSLKKATNMSEIKFSSVHSGESVLIGGLEFIFKI